MTIQYGKMGIEELEEVEQKDMVHSPAHYTQCSIECIDNMKMIFGSWHTLFFCLQNAYKYLSRHKFKNGKQDIKKALNYLNMAKKMSKEYALEMPWQYDEIRKQCESALEEYESGDCT